MCMYLCETHVHMCEGVCTFVRFLCILFPWGSLVAWSLLRSVGWMASLSTFQLLRLQAHSTHPAPDRAISPILFLFISFLTPDSQGCFSPLCLNNLFYCPAKMHTLFLTSPWNKPIENTLYAPKHIIVGTSESWSPACQSSLHNGLDRLHFARVGIISCWLFCSERTVCVEQNTVIACLTHKSERK